MRGLAVAVAILTVQVLIGGSLPVSAADEAAAAAPDADPASQPAAAQADYYTRRAATVLNAEKNTASKPHPLAEGHPGYEVVVCEAGCPINRTPQIVFARREAASVTQGELVPTSSHADAPRAPSTDDALTCVAGCYDKTAAVHFMPPQEASTPAWATSVEQAPPSAPAKPVPRAVPQRDKLSPIR